MALPQSFEVISGTQVEVNNKLLEMGRQKPGSKPILMDVITQGALEPKIYLVIQHG